MGKQFKEFEVPSLQAPNSQVRKKRAWKKQQRRKVRYRGLPGAVLPPDSLENRLRAFFEINPDLSEVGRDMCEAIARGVERRPYGQKCRAFYGCTENNFSYFCLHADSFKRWKKAKAIHLLGVTQKDWEYEKRYVADEAQDVLREYE